MKFEKLVEDLDKIVKDLENENVTLDKSIELFNKGLNVSKECIKILDESKGKISLLKDELGKLSEVDCDIQ